MYHSWLKVFKLIKLSPLDDQDHAKADIWGNSQVTTTHLPIVAESDLAFTLISNGITQVKHLWDFTTSRWKQLSQLLSSHSRRYQTSYDRLLRALLPLQICHQDKCNFFAFEVGGRDFVLDRTNPQATATFLVLPQHQHVLMPYDEPLLITGLQPAAVALHRPTLCKAPQRHMYSTHPRMLFR
jgi:hypothetical protein